MKSFIRSYRHTNLIENNHNISNSSNVSILNAPPSNFKDNLDFFDSPKKIVPQEFSTPPPPVHNLHHSSPLRHSPTFESFHRLASKTHKLFKKSSNSNLRSNIDLTNTVSNNNGVNNESIERRNKIKTTLSSLSSIDKYTKDVDDIPASKGTVVHPYGSSNKQVSMENNNDYLGVLSSNNNKSTNIHDTYSEDYVIHLNAQKNNNNNNESLSRDTNNQGNLSPPVKILGKSSFIDNETKKNYYDRHQNDVTSVQDSIAEESKKLSNELSVPKIRITHFSKEQKYKNRKSLINSNRDSTSLQADTMDDRELNAQQKGKSNSSSTENNSVLSGSTIQKSVISDISTVSENDDYDESGSENETDTSEFSFEYSRLNGRTSSIKYYSKPAEEEETTNQGKVYINDIYDDENFDEDMNFDDGEEVENIDYNFHDLAGHNISQRGINNNENNNNNKRDDSIMDISKELTTLENPITKYKDLFEENSSGNNGDDDTDKKDSSFKDQEQPNNNSIIQSVMEANNKITNYNDLFDISDSDNDKNKNGYEDDTVIRNNDECNNKQKSNNGVDLYNALFTDDYMNSGHSSMNGCNFIKANHLVNKNENVERTNVDSQKMGVNSVSLKLTAKNSHQLQSYNDLFDISDEENEEEEEEEIQNKGNNKTVAEPQQINSNHILQNRQRFTESSSIDSNPPTIPETVSTPKDYKPKYIKNNNITKYSDLFDLSDDEDTTSSIDDSISYANQELHSTLNSSNNSISDDQEVRTRFLSSNNIWNTNQASKSPLLVTTNTKSQLSVKPKKKLFIRSYRNLPVLTDDYSDENDTENESLTPLTTPVDVVSPLYSRQHTPLNNNSSSPTANNDGTMYIQIPTSILPSKSLPPTARSNILKYHDLNSNLDSEVPGLTSTLYFIDEAEEDEYNNYQEKRDLEEEAYTYDLDEINKVPEDFDFSEEEIARSRSKHLRTPFGPPLSFRKTHSYYSKPIGVLRGTTPLKNRIEINNKTVTFFKQNCPSNVTDNHNSLNYRSVENRTSPSKSSLTSPSKMDNNNSKDFSRPTPLNTTNSPYSLSPIQELSSATSSPERK